MKSKVTLMLASLLILGACSTGTYVTRTYEDDIYFTPGDIEIPAVLGEYRSSPQSQAQTNNAVEANDPQVVISETETFNDGTKALNNYIFQDKNQNDYLNANLDALDEFDLVQTDTTVIGDEEDYQYIINNYYQMDDLDYSNRINRFHRPYVYSSFGWNNGYWNDWYWNDWYSPYSSWNYGGWGYSPFYSGFYGSSWYSPYYYGSWGWPYYRGYYSPYYSSSYYGGYNYNSRNYHYGKREEPYRTVAGGGRGNYASSVSRTGNNNLKSGSTGRREYTTTQSGVSSRRENPNGYSRENRGATLTERRRTADTNTSQRGISTSRTSVRTGAATLQNTSGTNRSSSNGMRNNTPVTTSRTYQSGTTTQQRTYVPSYNKPRTVTRSTYNSNSYNRTNSTNNSAPRVVRSNSTTYSKPQSTSGNSRSTYQSNSSYNRGSSSSSRKNSGSSYSRSSSSSSPSRSSNSSYSSGSSRSYSSGSSGSYSSGSRSSSGSSNSSRGSSSNSGRSSSGRR